MSAIGREQVTRQPDFGRFRTALLGGQPDRVPLAELLVDPELKQSFLGRPIRNLEDEVEFWVTAGYDYVPVEIKLTFKEIIPELSRVSETEESPTGLDAVRRVWAEEHSGVITTFNEFECYPWPDPRELDYSAFDEIIAVLPDGMQIVVVTGGALYYPTELMGFETFCYALTDAPSLVAAVFERVGEVILAALERATSFERVGAVWFCSDMAYTEGLLISPQDLRHHVFPWIRRAVEISHDKGLPLILHSDGDLSRVLPELIACGIDALHPIEPKAMDIKDVKRLYGDDLCLIGNIDLAYTLTMGSPEEVAAEVNQRIRDVAPGGGYCLGSSNSVTDYVPLANYKAMIDTGLEYGRYPIRLK